MMTPWRMTAIWIASLLIGFAPSSGAQSADVARDEVWEAVRSADMILATVGYRLATANADICDRREPALGLQLHTLAQYDPVDRAAVRAQFRFAGPVAVAGVVADSPAAAAGIRADDTITAIGAVKMPTGTLPIATTAPLVEVNAALAALPVTQPIRVAILREGRPFSFDIVPVPACRTRFELALSETLDARADGELVQITSAYLERFGAELFPATVAHELAHNILRHRDRLRAAGVDFGLASGFGRNVAYFRQAEVQADILAVHLLVRAGYPVDLSPRFWRAHGGQLAQGMIRSRSHPAWRDRLATIEAEAARIVAAAGMAPLPPFVADRDQPLDGNWRSLLVRAR